MRILDNGLPSRLEVGAERLRSYHVLPFPLSRKVVYEYLGEYHDWSGTGCYKCPWLLEVIGSSYGSPTNCGFVLPEACAPFSVRSVMVQLGMSSDVKCHLFVAHESDEYGNDLWRDECAPECGGCVPGFQPCHLVVGWSKGSATCVGWQLLERLCQSEPERKVLWQYLRYAKGAEVPMLLPQVHLDRERYRIDFVAVVPNSTRDQYTRYAVEVDPPPYHGSGIDSGRQQLLERHGFVVRSLDTKSRWIDQVRELLDEFESLMGA